MKKLLPVFALMALAATSGCFGYKDFSTPSGTVTTYLLACKAKNFKLAYQCLSAKYKQQVPLERFRPKNLNRYKFVLPKSENYGIQDVNYLDDNHAMVPYFLGSNTIHQLMIREDGKWKMPSPSEIAPPGPGK